MAELTLAIAALSLVIACLSLGWQIASWLLDGRRVKLVLKHGARGHAGAALGPVGRDGAPRDLRNVRAQGFVDTEVLAVTVINVGRAPVVVERYAVVHESSGMSFSPLADAIGVNLPFELGPGRSETWYADMDDVRALNHAAAAIDRRGGTVRMTVDLGTGDTKKTRERMRLN